MRGVCGKQRAGPSCSSWHSADRSRAPHNDQRQVTALARRDTGARGFSMIEVTVVVGIMLILAGFAIPQLMNLIYLSRVRDAADGLAGLIQQARITAEKQNTVLPLYTGTVETNATGAFVGLNGSTWQSGNPDIAYANGVSNGSASNVPTALSPGFTAETAGTTLYFNWRGLPVKSSGGSYVASAGVIFYLTDAHNNWAAVSVSAAGRSKVWILSGTAWH
jgi:prepilin-type N-terminal cleavage/methylation domain-containing protein